MWPGWVREAQIQGSFGSAKSSFPRILDHETLPPRNVATRSSQFIGRSALSFPKQLAFRLPVGGVLPRISIERILNFRRQLDSKIFVACEEDICDQHGFTLE